MAEVLIENLIRATRAALRAMNRAIHADDAEQRNRQLRYLGKSLAVMGAITVALSMQALVQLPERIFAYPTYMHVIFTVILGFTVLSGLAGITFGIALIFMNNPGQYCRVAMVMVWASCVAAALAIGILLASFSLST